MKMLKFIQLLPLIWKIYNEQYTKFFGFLVYWKYNELKPDLNQDSFPGDIQARLRWFESLSKFEQEALQNYADWWTKLLNPPKQAKSEDLEVKKSRRTLKKK
jgi:hypothetical protein